MGLLSTASLEPDKHDLHASGSTGVGAKLRSWWLRETLSLVGTKFTGRAPLSGRRQLGQFKRP